MLVVLSVTMATQYSITRIAFSYTIVHPSDADIRFIGSDNASDGRLLRVSGTNDTSATLTLDFGNWSVNTNKTFSAAFGIVNEEYFAVNITNISVATDYDHMKIVLHSNPDQKCSSDTTSVFAWGNGSAGESDPLWTLAYGDNNPTTCRYNVSNSSTEIKTPFDPVKQVRYTRDNTETRNANLTDNKHNLTWASDYVWVEISIDLTGVEDSGARTGNIWVNFEAAGHWGRKNIPDAP